MIILKYGSGCRLSKAEGITQRVRPTASRFPLQELKVNSRQGAELRPRLRVLRAAERRLLAGAESPQLNSQLELLSI